MIAGVRTVIRQRGYLLAICTVCMAVFGIGVALAPVVAAHAQLRMSDPAQNATVAQAPAQVTLTFSEETSPTKSGGSVTDASGATVSTGFAVDLNDRTKMTIPLKAGIGPGTYTVKWNSFTEDDGGMLDGTFVFSVGMGSMTGAAGATTAATPAATTAGSTSATTNTGAASTASRGPSVTLVPAVSTAAANTGGGGSIPIIVWVLVAVGIIGVIAFGARFVAAQQR